MDVHIDQGEPHGGKTEVNMSEDLVIVDDFFGTAAATEMVTNGNDESNAECVLRIDEDMDNTGKDDESSRLSVDKESSPEIIVGSVESVENVTLKDATSEKVLLRNGDVEEKDRLSSQGDDERKRRSSSDMDMDFAVLEADSSHLNLDLSKQKSSLSKKGSMARRKKPSRGAVTSGASDSSDTMYQDSTEVKPVTSPTSDVAEDEVFDKHATTSEPPEPTNAPPTKESIAVRKAALPFKPSMVMPGLQDLNKSKLFTEERKKSGESPTSPIKSPQSPFSPTSPSHKPAPPLVLPKPTSKVQKDSQNKTIAAEMSAHTGDSDTSNTSVSASVEEAVIVSDPLSDSASSVEGPKPVRGDSGSSSGPKPSRTDSWSSVSSPRRLSRGDSISSIEGGDGVPTTTTPRRASIQGSAYAPIGFKPRRSSSIVLDSNNKLIDVPAVPSSTVPEESSESSVSSGVKPPLYKAPAWLSEMKAKTALDSASRLRSTSASSTDGGVVSPSSPRSRNGSESAGSVEGAQGGSVNDDGVKKGEEEPEKPSWLKSTQQKPSAVAVDKTDGKKDDEENEEEDDKPPVPPWAAELKKKGRPVVAPRSRPSTGDSNGKATVAPFKGANEKENAPVVNSSRNDYTPSWMKQSQQIKKPPPPVAAKPSMASTSKPGVDLPSQNRMKQYETPKWKLDLAEKKKKRVAEMLQSSMDSDDPPPSLSPGRKNSDVNKDVGEPIPEEV